MELLLLGYHGLHCCDMNLTIFDYLDAILDDGLSFWDYVVLNIVNIVIACTLGYDMIKKWQGID